MHQRLSGDIFQHFCSAKGYPGTFTFIHDGKPEAFSSVVAEHQSIQVGEGILCGICKAYLLQAVGHIT
jgi:hypothetical protein